MHMKLFDKRDDFPFAIVRMPFASSNMPTSMFYGSIGAEILRVGRVSSSTENFIFSSKILVQDLQSKAPIMKNRKTKFIVDMMFSSSSPILLPISCHFY